MTEADGEKSSEKRTRGGGNGLGEDEMEQPRRVEGRREGPLSVCMCHPRGGETGLR